MARNSAGAKAIQGRLLLSLKCFDAQFPTVLASHTALQGFYGCSGHRNAVRELLSAVVDGNSSAPANKFVMPCFVGILKPSPAAYVVNKYRLKRYRSGHNVVQ